MKLVFRFWLLVVVVLTLQSSGASAQSHCSPNEIMYFSCKIEHSERYASVCGSNVFATESYEFEPGSWLQFRFGQLGKPELIYPKEKKDSLAQFVGDYFSHKAVGYFDYSLWFVKGGPQYRIRIAFGDQGGTYGIRVKKQDMNCENMSAERYRIEGDTNDNFTRLVQALKAREK